LSNFRIAAVAALISCAGALGLAGTASAQTVPTTAKPITRTLAVSGTKSFKGTYKIDRFATRNGKLVTVGTLKGTLKKKGKTKSVKRNGVIMPAAATGAGPADLPVPGATTSQALPDIPNACQVLNLRLQPITLNLLGLVVRTNDINVRIDAVPGNGNLLGNLLCSITNLLNPGGGLGPLTTALNQLTAALNAILAVIPQGA
jgi:hypothetical protein